MSIELKLIFSMQFVASMAYLQILPFYPSFLRLKKIQPEVLNYMMSVFSFAVIITSVLTGKFLLKKIKRIDGCYIGSVLIIVNIMGLGIMDKITNNTFVITMSMVLQAIGGIGNGICATSALAIISSCKKNRQLYIGYWEIMSGLGTLAGPTIGAGFYELGGY